MGGLTIQGGADLALTAKIASVKRFSPADRAGLEKMDYVYCVNNKEVFKMTQKQITNEIANSQLKLTLQGERGWGWSTSWRRCSTTDSATSPSQTTSPPAAGWASRSTNTTTPWSATTTTPSRR